jgi:hypothetical protein
MSKFRNKKNNKNNKNIYESISQDSTQIKPIIKLK